MATTNPPPARNSPLTRVEVFEEFTIPVKVCIRFCEPDDLPELEWFGLFTPHREIIRTAFERHERGENLMLVAEANHFPVGQVWIDLKEKADQSVGVIWAMRVIPSLQNLGIGAHLLMTAERILRHRGFACAELAVEQGNTAAQRFYDRHGYHRIGAGREEFAYRTPDGVVNRLSLEKFVLRKVLRAPEAEGRPQGSKHGDAAGPRAPGPPVKSSRRAKRKTTP